MTFLETILHHKAEEVERVKRVQPLDALCSAARYGLPVRSLAAAVRERTPAIIAELKKASPSKGLIRQDFRPVDFARDYEAGGACALSVLTDERFFSGSLTNLELAREAVSIPVLRKDFIIDEYQIHEARAHGADAILLIVAALEPPRLMKLMDIARAVGVEALVEVHSVSEADIAVQAGASLIGINNRDLHTFAVDLRTTTTILPHLPPGITVISESGIGTADQVRRLMEQGVHAFLLGESLMRTDDPGKTLADLIAAVGRSSS